MHPVLRSYQRLFVKNFLEVFFFFLTYGMSRNWINWITAKINAEIFAESLQVMNIKDWSYGTLLQLRIVGISILVPEVFLDFSSRKRSRASREAATPSRESDEEREKNPGGGTPANFG